MSELLVKPRRKLNRVNGPSVKKQQLLELAKTGEPRPDRKTSLGGAFLNYSIRTHGVCYDQSFTDEVRELRPDWFSEKASVRRERLIKMAKNGATRPESKTSDWMYICRSNSKGQWHDPEFCKTLKALRPDWFENSVDSKKDKLLAMAAAGEARPATNTNLGKSFHVYAINTFSSSYDSEFVEKIRAVNPAWVMRQSEAVAKQKAELIIWAGNVEERPKVGTTEYRRMYSYGSRASKTFDAAFRAAIDAIRPDWYTRTL